MFATVIALKYVSDHYGHFLKLTDSILFEYHDKPSPFNSTHYIVLYIPTKWRSYRDHRLCDVTSPCVLIICFAVNTFFSLALYY